MRRPFYAAKIRDTDCCQDQCAENHAPWYSTAAESERTLVSYTASHSQHIENIQVHELASLTDVKRRVAVIIGGFPEVACG